MLITDSDFGNSEIGFVVNPYFTATQTEYIKPNLFNSGCTGTEAIGRGRILFVFNLRFQYSQISPVLYIEGK